MAMQTLLPNSDVRTARALAVVLACPTGGAACAQEPTVRYAETQAATGKQIDASTSFLECATDIPADSIQPAELTWPSVIELVLGNDSDIRAAQWGIEAAEGRAQQARALPNPELTVEVEDIRLSQSSTEYKTWMSVEQTRNFEQDGLTIERAPFVGRQRSDRVPAGFREAEVTVTISQRIELGGKRRKRVAAAQEDLSVATTDFELAKSQAVRLAAMRYADVLAAQKRLKFAQELARLLEGLHLDVGAIDADTLEVERNRAQVLLAVHERELDTARIRLAETWGSAQADFASVAGDLGFPPTVRAVDDVLSRFDEYPSIQHANTVVDHRDAVVQLERARAVPDVTLSLGYRWKNLASRRAEAYEWTPFSAAVFTRENKNL